MVAWRGLQVLPDCQEVDIRLTHVVHDLHDLVLVSPSPTISPDLVKIPESISLTRHNRLREAKYREPGLTSR